MLDKKIESRQIKEKSTRSCTIYTPDREYQKLNFVRWSFGPPAVVLYLSISSDSLEASAARLFWWPRPANLRK